MAGGSLLGQKIAFLDKNIGKNEDEVVIRSRGEALLVVLKVV